MVEGCVLFFFSPEKCINDKNNNNKKKYLMSSWPTYSDSHRELSRLSGCAMHRCLFLPLLAVLCTAGGAGWKWPWSLFLVTSIFRRKSLTAPDALTEAAGTSLKAEALTECPLYLHSFSPCTKAEVCLVDSALGELISGRLLLMRFVSLGGHGFKWGTVGFSESFAESAISLVSL